MADFEPNDIIDDAIGAGVLSLTLDGGSVNSILFGDVALIAGTTAADPADYYRYVISPGLQQVYFSPGIVSFGSNALAEPGVHGVVHILNVQGLGGFIGNQITLKEETGSYVKANSDEYYALLSEIDTLETQMRGEDITKTAGGVIDVALRGDIIRARALKESVFSLMEPGLQNIDHDQFSANLEAELASYGAGSGYIDDIRGFMERTIALADNWDVPHFAIGDAAEPDGWREVDTLEFLKTRVWDVVPGSTEAFVNVWGYQALNVAGAYAEPFARPTTYHLTLSVKREADLTAPAPPDPVSRIGDEGNNRLEGGAGNDVLDGGAGDDRLEGGAGNDRLIGGAGFDMASYRNATGGVTVDLRVAGQQDVGGGQGVDTLIEIEDIEGSDNEDVLQGDNRDNLIAGRGARDVIYGWDGNDLLFGGWGKDSLRGGADDDKLWGDGGHDFLIGNRGDDVLIGGTGDDGLDGGNGFDFASYEDATAGVYVDLRFSGRDVGAGLGRDTFTRIEGLLGSAFDDRLVGDSAGNHIEGDAGDDIILGKGGDDSLYGGAGNDRLRSADGNDILAGDAGSDILLALGGADLLFGWEGRDFLYGGRGADTLNGGLDDDVLRGNRDDDILRGNEGADDLRGGGGDDSLTGGAQDDVLFGQNGQDRLDGGAGNDVMTGGSGAGSFDGQRDVFVFAPEAQGGGGFDRIKDFENGIDRIDISGFGFANFPGDVAPRASDASGGLRLEFSASEVLFLEGMSVALFDASDVIL